MPLFAVVMLSAVALLSLRAVLLPAAATAYTVETKDIAATGEILISPVKVELELDQGEKATTEIEVTNATGEAVTLDFSTEDFEGSHDPSQAVVYMGDEISQWGAGLWLEPELDSIDLDPGEAITFDVKASVPSSASPGGHYGAIIVTPSGAGDPVRSLFLITVTGDITRSGLLNPLEIPGFSDFGPIRIGLVFNNDGYVHLKPSGKVTIRTFYGRKVAEIPVNGWVVLPDSSRRTQVEWDSRYLFGRYTATAELSYDGGETTITSASSFWVIPWQLVAAAAGVLLAILLLIIWIRRRSYSDWEYETEAMEPGAARPQPSAGPAAGGMPAAGPEPAAEPAPAVAPGEAAVEPEEAAAAVTGAGEAAVQPPEEAVWPEPRMPMEAAGKYIPLRELFPSMQDTEVVVNVDDKETMALIRGLIDDEVALARSYITQGMNDEARRELAEARSAAWRIGLLSEVGIIDDMLQGL